MTGRRADGSFYGCPPRGRTKPSQSRRPNLPRSGSLHEPKRFPKGTRIADIPSVLGLKGLRSFLNPQAHFPRTPATERGSHRKAGGGVDPERTRKLAYSDPTGHTFSAPYRRKPIHDASVDIYRQVGLRILDNAFLFVRNLVDTSQQTIRRVIG